MGQIFQYGVSNSFNYPIYLFYDFNYLMLYKKPFILQEFLREHDPHGETMGVGIGSISIYLPMRDMPVTLTSTPFEQHTPVFAPPKQHTLGCAHDVRDAEHDAIAHFQASFLGSSCVARTGTLSITFLVDDDLSPMKLEKLPNI